MFVHKFDPEDPDSSDTRELLELLGPGQADQQFRQAVHWCWLALAKDQRSADEVERQTRRLLDRALRDFREDCVAFMAAASKAHPPPDRNPEPDRAEAPPSVACFSTNVGQSGQAALDAMQAMFSPGLIDQQVRAAVGLCWMLLPKPRRSADEVERQTRRLLDRALRDFREDLAAFGGADG